MPALWLIFLHSFSDNRIFPVCFVLQGDIVTSDLNRVEQGKV